eukprot:COSAG06_NODE_997_length_11148_cov_5.400489_6_plen_81_part_00
MRSRPVARVAAFIALRVDVRRAAGQSWLRARPRPHGARVRPRGQGAEPLSLDTGRAEARRRRSGARAEPAGLILSSSGGG